MKRLKRHHRYRHLVAVTLWIDRYGSLCGVYGHSMTLQDTWQVQECPIFAQYSQDQQAILDDCYRLGRVSRDHLDRGYPVECYLPDEWVAVFEADGTTT